MLKRIVRKAAPLMVSGAVVIGGLAAIGYMGRPAERQMDLSHGDLQVRYLESGYFGHDKWGMGANGDRFIVQGPDFAASLMDFSSDPLCDYDPWNPPRRRNTPDGIIYERGLARTEAMRSEGGQERLFAWGDSLYHELRGAVWDSLVASGGRWCRD